MISFQKDLHGFPKLLSLLVSSWCLGSGVWLFMKRRILFMPSIYAQARLRAEPANCSHWGVLAYYLGRGVSKTDSHDREIEVFFSLARQWHIWFVEKAFVLFYRSKSFLQIWSEGKRVYLWIHFLGQNHLVALWKKHAWIAFINCLALTSAADLSGWTRTL